MILIPMHPLSILFNPKKIFLALDSVVCWGGVGEKSDVLCGGRSIQAADYYLAKRRKDFNTINLNFLEKEKCDQAKGNPGL